MRLLDSALASDPAPFIALLLHLGRPIVRMFRDISKKRMPCYWRGKQTLKKQTEIKTNISNLKSKSVFTVGVMAVHRSNDHVLVIPVQGYTVQILESLVKIASVTADVPITQHVPQIHKIVGVQTFEAILLHWSTWNYRLPHGPIQQAVRQFGLLNRWIPVFSCLAIADSALTK